ncbi:Phage integrase family protein [Cohaesibacter marisflavi]|uniref:Phage integrase family protein n=1 Tax=Cohaesibacter marisflavi TaxID=655353 RepID=A0A1I5I3N9_9HYPH|nr:site-specific integrase [Cohaesibacter marisflavi]SFO54736.1 Phage integrase family protein [Cohaesibacter marisflavi]
MYFWTPRLIKFRDGERFATCFDKNGIPAYYPTALALEYRSLNLASSTLLSYMKHVAHFERCCIYNSVDIIRNIEAGKYPTAADATFLAQTASVNSKALANAISPNVSRINGKKWSRAEMVNNQTKAQRITVFAALIDLVCRAYESRQSKEIFFGLANQRERFLEKLLALRPKVRDLNRISKGPTHHQLGRLTRFMLDHGPHDCEGVIWQNPALNERNWAIAQTLFETGFRNSELRALRVKDVNFELMEIRVFRRPDDPDDPRLREPNVKTYEKVYPISDRLCMSLEKYLLSHGGNAADRSGSPFFFLSHSNRNFGQPIANDTVNRIATDIGLHLEILNLTPHHFRHQWIQNLADWSIRENIEPAEFDRFANMLGGWSLLSNMATQYRGDQLTKYAYKKGLMVEQERNNDI